MLREAFNKILHLPFSLLIPNELEIFFNETKFFKRSLFVETEINFLVSGYSSEIAVYSEVNGYPEFKYLWDVDPNLIWLQQVISFLDLKKRSLNHFKLYVHFQ